MGMITVICQHHKEHLFTKYFFLLMVAPDILPVSGDNDAIKRLSSVSYFSQKKLQEGAGLSPHEKRPVKHLLQQESKLCISVVFTQVNLVCTLTCIQA